MKPYEELQLENESLKKELLSARSYKIIAYVMLVLVMLLIAVDVIVFLSAHIYINKFTAITTSIIAFFLFIAYLTHKAQKSINKETL